MLKSYQCLPALINNLIKKKNQIEIERVNFENQNINTDFVALKGGYIQFNLIRLLIFKRSLQIFL